MNSNSTVKFFSISSGSCGNCYFLSLEEDGAHSAGVIIDAGVSLRRLKKGLAANGYDMDSFSAILVTHDHLDHIRHLGAYCKHLCKPVFATPVLHGALSRHPFTSPWIGGCSRELKDGDWNTIVPDKVFAKYFIVPHDASQTVGYALWIGGYKFVIMTDVGRMVPQGIAFASAADTVVVESNYDPEMLFNGPYPPELQVRISDGHGHMSNRECAEAVRAFDHEGLQNVFLCHLSEHNNTPELAMAATRPVLDASVRVCPLPRMTPSPMFDISKRQ